MRRASSRSTARVGPGAVARPGVSVEGRGAVDSRRHGETRLAGSPGSARGVASRGRPTSGRGVSALGCGLDVSGRVISGRAGSGRAASGRVISGRVGSGRAISGRDSGRAVSGRGTSARGSRGVCPRDCASARDSVRERRFPSEAVSLRLAAKIFLGAKIPPMYAFALRCAAAVGVFLVTRSTACAGIANRKNPCAAWVFAYSHCRGRFARASRCEASLRAACAASARGGEARSRYCASTIR